MVGSSRWLSYTTVALLYLFLLAPIFIVIPLSFSNDGYLTFPPTSWGVRWYLELFQHSAMLNAFGVSVRLATTVTVIAVLTGIPAAYALKRIEFSGREFVMSLFTAPLLLPSIVLGLAMLLVFVDLRLLGTFNGLVIAHLIVTTPYVIRITVTALGGIASVLEEAAATLGARPLTVFFRVTLPLMLPGVIASAALAFLISFDEVVLSLFITGPAITTLPVEMFGYVETRTDPMIAAVSTMLIVVTVALITLVEKSIGLSKAIGK